MKKNMGTIDKSIRVAFAALVALLYFSGVIGGMPAVILGALAGIMVLTSAVGFCPLYIPIGLSTRKQSDGPESDD